MTKQELTRAIHSAGEKVLVDHLISLNENERSALASTAYAEYRRVIRLLDADTQQKYQKNLDVLNADLKRLKVNTFEINKHQLTSSIKNCAILAVLGCCSKTDAKKVEFWRFGSSLGPDRKPEEDQARNSLQTLILNRKPDWLKEWLEHEINQGFSDVDWNLVSFCIKNQLCERPETDKYIEMMTTGIKGIWGNRPGDSLLTILEDNEWLFNHEIYRIFEVDSWCFEKRHDEHKNSWRSALIHYQARHPEHRQRLLSHCLKGLLVNLKNPVHQGFIHFYQGFDLSIEDRLSLESLYIGLLGSDKSFIRGFALQELERLFNEADIQDRQAFLMQSTIVLSGSVTSQQKKCLRLLKLLVKKHPSLLTEYLNVIIGSLVTDIVEIQERLIKILDEQGGRLDEAQIEVIRQSEGFISATLKHPFESLLKSDHANGQSSLSAIDINRVAKRVSELSDVERSRAGLSKLGVDLRGKLQPNQVHCFDIRARPRIDPVNSADELIKLVGGSIELCEQPEVFERVLDGISRLHRHGVENFALKTDSIRSRLEKKPSEKGLCSLRFGCYELNRTLLQWIASHQNMGLDDWYREPQFGIHRFLDNRVLEVKQRLMSGIEAPLLALPTHQGGWLAAGELVSRIQVYLDQEIPIPQADFQQALLRLPKNSKDEGLNSLAGSEIIHLRLIAFALGMTVEFAELDVSFHALWVTAARVRQVEGDIAWPGDFSLSADLEYLLKGPEYSWQYEKKYMSGNDGEKIPYDEELCLVISGVDSTVYSERQDFLSLWMRPVYLQYHSAYLIRLYTICMPSNLDMLLANGITAIRQLIDRDSHSETHLYALFEPFCHSYQRLTPTALQALVLGLVSKNGDVQGMAIEAASVLIEEEQLDIFSMFDPLMNFSETGLVKQVRLSSALAAVSQVSNRHRGWVKNFLEAYIMRVADKPHSLHLNLELLLEIYHLFDCGPDIEMVKKLKLYKGSSKLARAARKICALGFQQESDQVQCSRLESIEKRLIQLKCDYQ
jgi:hypothetical protein